VFNFKVVSEDTEIEVGQWLVRSVAWMSASSWSSTRSSLKLLTRSAGASGWQRWFFVCLGLVASAFIVWMLNKHPTQTRFCFAVSTIMGDALGNVIYRLLHGHVVDFTQLHYGGWHFPAFNVADSAITLGAQSA